MRSDWVAAWVAGVSALIALGSLIITLWVRARDRKEADWWLLIEDADFDIRLRQRFVDFVDEEDKPKNIALFNDGDGPAYRVQLSGTGIRSVVFLMPDPNAEQEVRLSDIAPRVGSGEHITVLLWIDEGFDLHQMEVLIRWRLTPTRHRVDEQKTVRMRDQLSGSRLKRRWFSTSRGLRLLRK